MHGVLPHLAPLILLAAALGWGSWLVRALGLWRETDPAERFVFASAAGVGVLGWAVFPLGVAGVFGDAAFGALLGLGVVGLVNWASEVRARRRPEPITAPQSALLLLFLAVCAVHLVNGLAPPTDADSLAYHFALPKQFLNDGRITFVPRAVDGAAPLLVQMTYIPARWLGGEAGMTLWPAVLAVLLGLNVTLVARRRLGRGMALTTGILVLTTPAVVYAAATGQVETKNALFVLAAALAVARSARTGDWRWAVLAGILAGFFFGGKYIGLLFAAAAGTVLLTGRGWLRRGALFSVAVLVTGGQWYLWNFLHTGDPVFPMLWSLLSPPDGAVWTAAHDAVFRARWAEIETALPATPGWMLAYPVLATFAPLPGFDAGRVGFGPLPILLLPFALVAAACHLPRAGAGDMGRISVLALLFYGLWFFISSSQRIRHLVPLLPVLWIVLMVGADWTARRFGLMRPLVLGLALTGGLQMGGQTLHGANAARYVFGGESRQSYLERNISGFGVIRWINANLGPGDRITVTRRPFMYFLDVPYYFSHYLHEIRTDTGLRSRDAAKFERQARALGLTHLLVSGDPSRQGPFGYAGMAVALWKRDRAVEVHRHQGPYIGARTLSFLGVDGADDADLLVVLRLKDPSLPTPEETP